MYCIIDLMAIQAEERRGQGMDDGTHNPGMGK